MKHFDSLGDFAIYLLEREVVVREELEHGLDRVLKLIERTAKSEFGHYQPAAGPFESWPELADSTKDDRVKRGFTENDPLYRSGGLQGSVERERHGLEGGVGSTDEKMAWMEFGTSKMPARPVLGPAAYRRKEQIEKLVGAAAVAGLVGGDIIHQALGYDFETGE